MKLTPGRLENRLFQFGLAVCEAIRRMPNDLVSVHIKKQLVRSATSPAAHYSEARGAESRRDFVHKMRLSLKELRETLYWLRLAHAVSKQELSRLTTECDELIAVFVQSIKTARGD